MRLATSGAVRRIDLQAALQLLPPVVEEWAQLTFDTDGAVVNPVTGAPNPAVVLVEGRHRQVGSRYAITIETSRLELPAHLQAEFDEQEDELVRSSASEEAWHLHEERRHQASVAVGVDRTRGFVTIRADNGHRLAVTVTDEDGHWTVDVDIRHGPLPHIELVGHVDLTALIRKTGTPGCLARFLGGSADASATVDLSTIGGAGGTLLDATGRMDRFEGSARAHVETSARKWRIDGIVEVRARGLGRIVLIALGRRVRRQAADELQQFWQSSEQWVGEVEDELRELACEVDRTGGAEQFAHRTLWDPDFDPGPRHSECP